MQAKIAAKAAQKVQVNYGYGETKRESVAGNSNREIFLNCTIALAGKFKKWVINSAPVLKTCVFDARTSTKNFGVLS